MTHMLLKRQQTLACAEREDAATCAAVSAYIRPYDTHALKEAADAEREDAATCAAGCCGSSLTQGHRTHMLLKEADATLASVSRCLFKAICHTCS
jgi:hypothetical protein